MARMDIAESLLWSHQALVSLKVPHALIGGMALSEYGYARGTQDVDWLIPEESVSAVFQHFTNEGFQVFHQSADVLQFTGKAEIDFLIARRPISRAMLQNAKYSAPLQLPVVQAEDLIGLKIQAYAGNPKRKHKELADIQELIENQPDLDEKKLKFYADHFHEWPTIEALLIKKDQS
ncbi:MAG: hypothetical protein JST80_09540 [Bdellovibrionales bacterium]|nr:hypothetical protein [Bdellovibrionales bacterium]